MKLLKTVIAAAVLGGTLVSAQAASYTFVGAWQVTDGPLFDFTNLATPLKAYTAQEAAAELFGGAAADYAISTSTTEINHQAYYSVLGLDINILAENYSSKYLDEFYASPLVDNGQGDQVFSFAAASAYVNDNFVFPNEFNYAYRITAAVPEPDSLALLMAGLGVLGTVARRRQPAAHKG